MSVNKETCQQGVSPSEKNSKEKLYNPPDLVAKKATDLLMNWVSSAEN